MLETQEKATTLPERESRRNGLVALLVIVILAAAAGGIWLLLRGGEQTPTDVIQDYAAAMRADDMESVAGFDPNTIDGGFIEWNIALKAEPTLTSCTETSGTATTRVSCALTYGDEYFHAVIAGEEATSVMGGTVDDEGVFAGSTWPPPAGLTAIEAEFRDWVKATHPEMENQMWGAPGYLGLKMTRESGELRMQLLDEYLAFLSSS